MKYKTAQPSSETKEATITIRVKPSVKAKAIKRATDDGRSIANYIERLIEKDAEKKAQLK
jgi:predicted HicB family RNase H-like nuclease